MMVLFNTNHTIEYQVFEKIKNKECSVLVRNDLQALLLHEKARYTTVCVECSSKEEKKRGGRKNVFLFA